jgi:hypothetical protein
VHQLAPFSEGMSLHQNDYRCKTNNIYNRKRRLLNRKRNIWCVNRKGVCWLWQANARAGGPSLLHRTCSGCSSATLLCSARLLRVHCARRERERRCAYIRPFYSSRVLRMCLADSTLRTAHHMLSLLHVSCLPTGHCCTCMF